MPEAIHLLSRKGRLRRKDHWIAVGLLVGTRIALAAAAVLRPDWDWTRHADFLILFIAFAMGKRMRDFGWSALWAIGAVLLLSFVVPLVQVVAWPYPHAPSNPGGALHPLTGVAIAAALLALIVALGIEKGDPGPNRFGRGPADAALARQIGAF